jgi:hypothetical protein
MSYDVSQICLNGHTITRIANRYPQFRLKFCKECGEATTMECLNCNTPIQGEYYVEGVLSLTETPPPPHYCHECGKAYPWTSRRIEAAKELADEFSELSEEERNSLKKSLDNIAIDSPKTEVAAIRFKRIMSKVGKESYSAMRTSITDVLSETAKKTILGG